MSAKGLYTVSAARFNNIQKMTGRTDLGKAPKNFTSVETAEKIGIPSLVKNRDGNNFCVILGPNGQCHYRTV
jgi:hypothetical protein